MVSRFKLVLLTTVLLLPISSDFFVNKQSQIVMAQSMDSRKAEGDRLLQQALQQFKSGQYKEVIPTLKQILEICRELKNRKLEGAILKMIGISYYYLSDYKQALDYGQQSLVIVRELRNRQDEGSGLGFLAIAHQALGHYTQAIDYAQQSLVIAREFKDRDGEMAALSSIEIANQSLGHPPKASSPQQQPSNNVQALQAKSDQLLQQGLQAWQSSQFEAAITLWQQALAIYRKIENRSRQGTTLVGIADAYRSLSNYGKAINSAQQSLVIFRQLHDMNGEESALRILGIAYHDLGNYAEALVYEYKSLAIAQKIKDREGDGAALGELGNTYQALGNNTKAIEYQEQTLKIMREIHDRRSEGAALGNLGVNYVDLGNYAEAIENFQQQLKIVRDLKDHLSERIALTNLGSVYFLLGNYPKGLEYTQQSLEIARKIQDHQGEGIALHTIGAILFKSGNLGAAEKTLRKAVVVHETIRQAGAGNDTNKVSIFEGQARTYRLLQEVLVAEHKPNLALEVSERGRARAFVDLLTQRLNPTPKQALFAQPPTLAQLQQIAKTQNATLVEYSIINEDKSTKAYQRAIFSWVVKPSGEVIFRQVDLTSQESLDELVTGTRMAMGVDRATLIAHGSGILKLDKAKQTQQLQKLHKLLIEPIADLLPTEPKQNVIFIPQGTLFSVPFAALQDQNGAYLIEKHTILTAPSIQVLDLTHQQKLAKQGDGKQTALVVGNPLMPLYQDPQDPQKASQLPPLKGAEAEAREIAPLLHTTAITGAQATKASITKQMGSAGIIHLATHGILDNQSGLSSAIALAPDHPGTPNDGLLTAAEILDMKLHADLVVLSACDTGRGRITGDGVIGLSRSLITAGVPSVIVSLWSVPDAPTAALMTAFYQQLDRSPNKAQALRQVMLTTMKINPNPLDWAAFTLIGEAQ